MSGVPIAHADDLQVSLTQLGQLATGLLSLEDSLTRVHDNRVNLYGFTGVLGRFDIGG